VRRVPRSVVPLHVDEPFGNEPRTSRTHHHTRKVLPKLMAAPSMWTKELFAAFFVMDELLGRRKRSDAWDQRVYLRKSSGFRDEKGDKFAGISWGWEMNRSPYPHWHGKTLRVGNALVGPGAPTSSNFSGSMVHAEMTADNVGECCSTPRGDHLAAGMVTTYQITP